MRTWFVFTAFLTLPFLGKAQLINTDGTSSLVFKTEAHDFGSIPMGKPVYFNFEFKNKGTTPIKLDDVHASCGCTTPDWPKEAIKAGASSLIKVGFSAATEGDFDKKIIVSYQNGKTIILSITGKVWLTPDSPAPKNGSIELLKKQSL